MFSKKIPAEIASEASTIWLDGRLVEAGGRHGSTPLGTLPADSDPHWFGMPLAPPDEDEDDD